MITINLLPQEYRRRDRTAPRVLAATVGAVLLVCSAAGFLGYRWFGPVQECEEERARMEENLKSLEQSAAYQEALVAEAAEYQKRSDTIQQISESRVLWTRKLDQLIDVVNNDGDTERHTVWFKNIQTKGGDGKTTGPSLTTRGVSQTDQFSKVANFLDDVQKHELFRDFMSISPPTGSVVTDSKRMPAEAVEFPFDMTMRPPSQWERNRGPQAHRAPAPQPAKDPNAAATPPAPGK